MTEAEFGALVQAFGLWIIAPIALVEGPAISVVSGYLARLGFLGLPQTYACLVVADLVGDSLLYLAGRRWRGRLATPWLGKLGLTRRRLAGGLRAFQAKGARLLVVGKLTHSAGFAVLVAAGMSRMAFGRFLALNLAATLPKVAGLMALGWGSEKSQDALRIGFGACRSFLWSLSWPCSCLLFCVKANHNEVWIYLPDPCL